jgi:two-component system CheB/CheR fusion protein
MTLDVSVRRMSILIVDHSREAAHSLALFLRLHGHDVYVAYSGGQALAAVRDFQPDVVFLDIGLRDIDAGDLAVRMRKVANRSPLLLALTGHWAKDHASQVKAVTFDHFVVKPVHPDEVLRVLGGYARQSPTKSSSTPADTAGALPSHGATTGTKGD